jgi:hypothetical protein
LFKVGGWDMPDIGDPGALPGGNIANFDDRWKWIEEDLVPAFDDLATNHPDQLREIIETSIGDRAEDERRLG